MKLELDIEQFWKDEETNHKDNCFSPDAKQVACGIRMSEECVFAELGEEGEPWGYTPPERRMELNKRYNEKAIKIVGRPLLYEGPLNPKTANSNSAESAKYSEVSTYLMERPNG